MNKIMFAIRVLFGLFLLSFMMSIGGCGYFIFMGEGVFGNLLTRVISLVALLVAEFNIVWWCRNLRRRFERNYIESQGRESSFQPQKRSQSLDEFLSILGVITFVFTILALLMSEVPG